MNNDRETPTDKLSCFISHAWAKGFHFFAKQLYEALNKHGIDVWIDEKEMLPGDNIKNSIQVGIKHRSDIFLFALSDEALQSKTCMMELKTALKSTKPIIPVLVESCSIPAELEDILYADFRHPAYFQAAVNNLAQGILKIGRTLQLIRVLDASNPTHRQRAAELLGILKDDRAVHAIEQRLKKEKDNNVKYWFAFTLGQFRDFPSVGRKAKRLLNDLLRDPSARVRQGAEEALK